MEILLDSDKLKIFRVISNHYRTNTYIVKCEEYALIVDPGFNISNKHIIAEIIHKFLNDVNRVDIFNTHGHLDHTCANVDFKEFINCKIMIHRADAYLLDDYTEHELIKMTLGLYDYDPDIFGHRKHRPDILLEDGYKICIDNLNVLLIHTPGHTMGSSVLYFEDVDLAITGDTILEGGIGRVDLPHSNPRKMFESIMKIDKIFDNSTLILPGHGEAFKYGIYRDLILREVESVISDYQNFE